MLVHNLLTVALLAGTAVAKPVSRTPLYKRQYTNTSISGITQTSTDDSTPTAVDSTPACTTTYIPSEEEDCRDIALEHGIQLAEPEADYDSGSIECKTILRGYGICPESTNRDVITTTSSSTTTFATATASIIPPSNVTSSNSTVNGTIPTNSTTTPTTNSTTNSTLAHAGVVTLTDVSTQTLTYIEGTGSATRQRVVVVTHTNIDIITQSTTTTARVNGVATKVSQGESSSRPATATSGETPSAFPTINESSEPPSYSSSISVVDVSSLATTTTSSSGISQSSAIMAPVAASSCAAIVPPPAATQVGIVSGCTQWYVAVPGDYCSRVADQFGIAVDTFMGWNPAVVLPICSNMQAGNAYCVATCEDAAAGLSSAIQATPSMLSSSAMTMTTSISLSLAGVSSSSSTAMSSLSTSGVSSSSTAMAGPVSTSSTIPVQSSAATSSSPAAPSSSSSTDAYTSYTGDGSVAAGWPAESSWISFDSMFAANQPDMKESCAQWGVPNDSDDEISEMKAAIQQVASASGVDARFILAIIMQESTGCVRVITTQYSVFNPGLMQSHNGTGSCNENNVSTDIPTSGPYVSNGVVQTPCPQSEIVQMIEDGTQGTSSGDGLQQLLAQQQGAGFTGVEAYYRTARAYNGGSVAASGNLEDGCCTRSYASDVANRLTGWVNAPRTFSA